MMNLILFITWCYFGSLILHIILAKIFRIDADNFLITSAAFIFSPPFVPMVANALKNKDVIVTGITGGIIGYIVGNYMGVALAYFLKGILINDNKSGEELDEVKINENVIKFL